MKGTDLPGSLVQKGQEATALALAQAQEVEGAPCCRESASSSRMCLGTQCECSWQLGP